MNALRNQFHWHVVLPPIPPSEAELCVCRGRSQPIAKLDLVCLGYLAVHVEHQLSVSIATNTKKQLIDGQANWFSGGALQ